MDLMDNVRTRATIQKMNQELTLNQRSFLLDCVVKCFKDMSEENKTKLWDIAEFITEAKYKYLLALFFAVKNSQAGTADRWLAREKFSKEINQLIEI